MPEAVPDYVRKLLVSAYTSESRHYHDIHHINFMLGLLEENREWVTNYSVLHAAIWFHDVIYDSQSATNEEDSCLVAADLLADKLSLPDIEGVTYLIMVTKTHEFNRDIPLKYSGDALLLMDLDLAILGEDPERYDEYVEDIRQEYNWATDDQWAEGRAQVIKSFLNRKNIFSTPKFQKEREQMARVNLIRELDKLTPISANAE